MSKKNLTLFHFCRLPSPSRQRNLIEISIVQTSLIVVFMGDGEGVKGVAEKAPALPKFVI